MSSNSYLKKLVRDWGSKPLSPKIDANLKRSFSLLDHAACDDLTIDSVREVLHIMGVKDIEPEVVMQIYREKVILANGFTYAVFKDFVRDLALQFRQQEGRY